MDEEHRAQGSTTPDVGVAVWSKSRKNITVSTDLFDAFMELKRDGETHGRLLQRVINSMHDFEQINDDLEDLEEEIDNLCSKSRACRLHRRSRRRDR